MRRKVNITFHGDGTMSFMEPLYYFWDEKRSKGNKLTDSVTQLDLVVAGLSHQLSYCEPNSFQDCTTPFLVNNILPALDIFDVTHELFEVEKRSIFKTYTVAELLFEGSRDPFLEKFKSVAQMGGQRISTKLGFMYGRNGSASGIYTIETGENGIDNYQNVLMFNGETSLSMWTNDYANRIEGSTGHGFGPFLQKGQRFKLFAGDVCRSAELIHNGTTDVDGIFTFIIKPPKDFTTWPDDPRQGGFCVPDTQHCPPLGVMDQTPCMKAPNYMGKPHFFEADPLLGSVFEGLNPNEDEHDTILRVDPITGGVFDVDKRIMVKSMATYFSQLNLIEAYFH